jgi:GTP-binding protein
VLDKLIEAIGPAPGQVARDDEGEDAIEWSPI